VSLKSLIASIAGKEVLLPVVHVHLLKQNERLRRGELTRRQWEVSRARRTIKALRRLIDGFNHGEEPNGYFHPSSVGRCLRELWFDHFDAPSETPEKAKEHLRWSLLLEFGTDFHTAFQNLCAEAGVLLRREIPVIDRKRKLIGRADGIVKVDGVKYVLEIKTIGSRQFSLLGESPRREHLYQAHLYMEALNLPRGVFVYYNKDNSRTREYVVQMNETILGEAWDRISTLRRHVAERTPPLREGVKPETFPCSFCRYTHLCFGVHHLEDFLDKLGSRNNSARKEASREKTVRPEREKTRSGGKSLVLPDFRPGSKTKDSPGKPSGVHREAAVPRKRGGALPRQRQRTAR